MGDSIKDLTIVYDELLDMFEQETGQDGREWVKKPESWAGSLDGGFKYLAMAVRLKRVIEKLS